MKGPARNFSFVQTPSSDGMDAFTVEAHHGKVFVTGTSSVAMCRGAYQYLKDACRCQVSWSGDNVDVPSLPDYTLRYVSCPNRYRHYFNVCTFGYTTVWWDWKRWQHEIDWMALHGINMPLAMNGQEKVWQEVFRGLGESDQAIQNHFTGPAFLPWHRMGNVDHHRARFRRVGLTGRQSCRRKSSVESASLE